METSATVRPISSSTLQALSYRREMIAACLSPSFVLVSGACVIALTASKEIDTGGFFSVFLCAMHNICLQFSNTDGTFAVIYLANDFMWASRMLHEPSDRPFDLRCFMNAVTSSFSSCSIAILFTLLGPRYSTNCEKVTEYESRVLAVHPFWCSR